MPAAGIGELPDRPNLRYDGLKAHRNLDKGEGPHIQDSGAPLAPRTCNPVVHSGQEPFQRIAETDCRLLVAHMLFHLAVIGLLGLRHSVGAQKKTLPQLKFHTDPSEGCSYRLVPDVFDEVRGNVEGIPCQICRAFRAQCFGIS